MKIAIVTLPDKPARKDSKGGTEVWTANFVLEAARRGHKVDLYALSGSEIHENITLHPLLDFPLPEYYSNTYFTEKPLEFRGRKEQFASTAFMRAFLDIKEHEEEFDLIIDSAMYPTFTFNTRFFKKPVVIIGHFPVGFTLEFYAKQFGISDNMFFVFPSKLQYNEVPFIHEERKTVIPHGIDITPLQFNEIGSDDMVWMSRIHHRMNKGAKEAIQVANDLNRHLNIVTYIEQSTEEYFHKDIKPLISENISFRRTTIDEHIDKNSILGEAKLFLFPLQWEEPFGLVLLEAMSCGTPVVAFAKGAIPEIIKDGETGFLVNPSESDKRGEWIIKKTGLEGIKEAVERIYSMSPAEYKKLRESTRKYIEAKFSVQRMVDDYEKFFKTLRARGDQ